MPVLPPSRLAQGLLCAVVLAAGCAGTHSPGPGSLAGEGLASYFRAIGAIEAEARGEVAFHDGGPAIKAGMLELVEGARDHILASSFLLTEGPESREVLDALAEKHRQGVRVHLIGDASSRFVPEPHAFGYLAERGVPSVEFNPVRFPGLLLLPWLLERDHRKAWIIDGQTVYLGGANINDPSLAAPEAGGNRDLMARIPSVGAARELTSSFVETWNEAGGRPALSAAEFSAPEAGSAGEGSAGRFWIFNQNLQPGHGAMSRDMFDGLFASAERSLCLVQPYTFVNPHILSRIREASGRGVEVNVFLSTQARAPRFRYASHYGIRDLLRAGSRVWIFDSETSPLHYKCVVADDRLAYVGSANLNLRSFRLSRELGVVFEDPAVVSRVREVVDSAKAGSAEATPEDAARARTATHFAWWLLMQLGG